MGSAVVACVLALAAGCGKARESGGPVCRDGTSCPDGHECVDGECVLDDNLDDGTTVDGGGSLVVFTDEHAADFGAGALQNVEYAADRVRLRADLLVGELRSRVLDAGEEGEKARWVRLRWSPARPYGKPLPDSRGRDEGYEAGLVDMAENFLLLHFDGTGPLAGGATIDDASGRANRALLQTDEPVAIVPGVFGGAFADTIGSSLAVDGASPDLQFGAGDFTWSLWVNASAPCQDSISNDAYIGGEEIASPRTHMWMGCLRSTAKQCGEGPINGRPSATVCGDQPNDCLTLCGSGDLPDGRWHHLAMRKRGHPEAEITLWFDGAVQGSGPATLADQLTFADGTDLGVGHFSTPALSDSDAQGALDEVALFRRALDDAEVSDLFLRGAVRLRFQARVCAEPDCSDAPPFVGPDGIEATAYEDPAGAAAGAPVDLTGLRDGRYFQYRALFETRAGAPSPELLAVSVEAEL